MRVIKPRNNNTYRIQSRNKHLMNVLELDYYIELGVVKMETINRFIKKEVINLNELIDTNLLVSGIGSITGDYEVDLNYQLNYLLNFRLKNSTYKLLLTAGIIKYYDEKNCEKYAPLVLIPFDLSYGVWTQVVDLTNSTITKWTPMNKALTRPVSNYSNFDSTDTGALHWDGTSLKLWNGTSWTNV